MRADGDALGRPARPSAHITGHPLPGAGGPNRMLVTPAWLDKQVPNLCTEVTARTLGLPSLEGSIQQGCEGPGSLCDGDRPFEIANGAEEACDPLE